MSRLRLPPRISRRAVRNQLRFMAGETTMEQAPPPRPRGKQKESAVGDAVRQWARIKGGVLYRNRRGMLDLPGGGKLPFGLGPPGYPDEVGYLPVRITPAMVGKVLPVYMIAEDKTDSGVVAEHQMRCIEEARDANCIAFVARNAQDCETAVLVWLQRVTADER